MNTETLICITLAGIFCVVALTGIAIWEKLRDLSEYCLRIAYGITQLSREQHGSADAIYSLSERLSEFADKFPAPHGETPAGEDPDSPDSMSEADKLAERRFSDGVLNILGYSGMPDEEVKT